MFFGIENHVGGRHEKLLTRPPKGEAVISLSSATAIAFCLSASAASMWMGNFRASKARARELAEMTLRTVQSILTDPGQPPRDGITLRRFVTRWLGPAIPLTTIDVLSRRY